MGTYILLVFNLSFKKKLPNCIKYLECVKTGYNAFEVYCGG